MSDKRVFFILNDFGRRDRAYLETDENFDREAAVSTILDGDVGEPIRVLAVDPDMADVSADISKELRRREGIGRYLSDAARNFCARHENT